MNHKARVVVAVGAIAAVVVLVVVNRGPGAQERGPEVGAPLGGPGLEGEAAVVESPIQVLEYASGEGRVRGALSLSRISCEESVLRLETAEGIWSAGLRDATQQGCSRLLGQLRLVAPAGSRVGVQVSEATEDGGSEIGFLSEGGSAMSMRVSSVTRERSDAM